MQAQQQPLRLQACGGLDLAGEEVLAVGAQVLKCLADVPPVQLRCHWCGQPGFPGPAEKQYGPAGMQHCAESRSK